MECQSIINRGVDRVSIEMSIEGIDLHLTEYAFSTHDTFIWPFRPYPQGNSCLNVLHYRSGKVYMWISVEVDNPVTRIVLICGQPRCL